MRTLDTFQDNVSLWRCIAVHRVGRPNRSTQVARALAKSFFKFSAIPNDCPKTSLNELDRVERHLNQGAAFSDWLRIRVYEPEREEDGEVGWHLRRNPSDKNILTIGAFDGHAFVIKDIARLAKTYVCVHCRARFKRCAQGEMVIDCSAERVKASQDTRALRRAGYTVIDMWSHNDVKRSVSHPQPFTRSYPHAILYDFDAYGDKNQRKEPTPMLAFENTHVPISVSTGDTLEREPTHIFEKDLANSWKGWKGGGEKSRKRESGVHARRHQPASKAQHLKIEEWCDQVPVFRFSSW